MYDIKPINFNGFCLTTNISRIFLLKIFCVIENTENPFCDYIKSIRIKCLYKVVNNTLKCPAIIINIMYIIIITLKHITLTT